MHVHGIKTYEFPSSFSMSILNGLENISVSYSAIRNYPKKFVKDYNTNF